jgi:hypothetical protein
MLELKYATVVRKNSKISLCHLDFSLLLVLALRVTFLSTPILFSGEKRRFFTLAFHDTKSF